MNSMQLSENIEDSIIRLKRHYAICKQGYDRAAFKDLAHTLRVWMDMKAEVDRFLTQARPASKFISYSFLPVFNKLVRQHEFIAVYFPKDVSVDFGAAKESANLPSQRDAITMYHDENKGLYAVERFNLNSAKFPIVGSANFYGEGNNDGLFKVTYEGNYCFSVSYWICIAREGVLSNSDYTKYVEYNKVKFGVWVSATAIRINYLDTNNSLILYNISRESLIRRVANILGASHPEGGFEKSDALDAPIRMLMEFKLLGIPTPYVCLLKIAQDILYEFA
ncbi:MAG: hypothetical protein ACRYFK_21020 [Janthinobacterium lividum]